MLKRQFPKLLQYTDYQNQIQTIEENMKCYIEKANFSRLDGNLFYLPYILLIKCLK